MAENTARFSPSADVDANEAEIADNWVNVKARPSNQTAPSSIAMERQISNVIDTINSFKDQLSQVAAALTNLKDHIGELETKMGRLESERHGTLSSSVPVNSSKILKREKAGYEDRFRMNRELLATLGTGSGTNLPRGSIVTENLGSRFTDEDLLEILQDGK